MDRLPTGPSKTIQFTANTTYIKFSNGLEDTSLGVHEFWKPKGGVNTSDAGAVTDKNHDRVVACFP